MTAQTALTHEEFPSIVSYTLCWRGRPGHAAADVCGKLLRRAIQPDYDREVSVIELSAREKRKLDSLLDRRRGSTWWAPGAAGWWIGVLFAIGATFFALGSTPFLNEVLGSTADSTIFFAGSIFFTSAAFLQYMEAINTGRRSRKGRRRIRIFVLELRDYGWWSSLVQLAGTLYFNVSTFRAMWSETFSTSQVNHLVWKPDIYGSACFLIASILAWLELGHALRVQRPRIISWWIVYLNLFGSVFFAISGISSFVLPTSGNDVDTLLVNLGTFLGALCFFAGAVLLLPERTQERLG